MWLRFGFLLQKTPNPFHVGQRYPPHRIGSANWYRQCANLGHSTRFVPRVHLAYPHDCCGPSFLLSHIVTGGGKRWGASSTGVWKEKRLWTQTVRSILDPWPPLTFHFHVGCNII